MAHDFGADKRAPGAEYKLLTRVGVTVHSPDTETGLHGTYCESLEDATESHKNQLHSHGANCDSEVIMHDFVFLEIGKMTLNVTDLRITVTLRELTVTCLWIRLTHLGIIADNLKLNVTHLLLGLAHLELTVTHSRMRLSHVRIIATHTELTVTATCDASWTDSDAPCRRHVWLAGSCTNRRSQTSSLDQRCQGDHCSSWPPAYLLCYLLFCLHSIFG